MLANFSIFSSLLPIIFFVIFCIKKATREVWVIFLCSTASFLIDGIVKLFPWATQHKFLIWNFYSILEFSLYSFFFYLIIRSRKIRLLIITFLLLYLVVFFLSSRAINDEFNSMMSAISSVILIILCLIYFMTTMKPSVEPVNVLTPLFLIVVAIFIYVTSTLFLYLIVNRLSTTEMHNYWKINDYSNILTNVILSFAFILYRFHYKNPPPENHSVDFTSPNDR